MKRTMVLAFAMSLVAVAVPTRAGETGERVGGTAEEAAKTGGHAVRDGALTFGRTTRDFFTKGPGAAKKTWRANARRTKEDARAGGHATRRAAHAADAPAEPTD